MDVALTHAGRGDLHEFGAVAQFLDRRAAAISHAGTHPTAHLEHDGNHGALVGHSALDALGNELVGVGVSGGRFLEIAVRTALLHGADGAHATIALVAATLIQDDFAGRLLGAGKHAS